MSPFVWNPLANTYGRRPVFLASTLGSFACNIGGSYCHSFGTQFITRLLAAFFISPPLGIGSAVVTEVFFSRERAQKIGWWTVMTSIGAAGGPFIGGFIIDHIGVQWLFWILAITNACQFIGYVAVNAETLYIPDNDESLHTSSKNPGRFSFHRINPARITARTIYSPFLLVLYPTVLIPTTAYALLFCYTGIAIGTQMPAIFGSTTGKFDLDAQGVGLQYIALILGAFLGEQISGPLSDFLQQRGVKHKPTHRLWFSYAGFACVVVGIVVWGVRVTEATEGQYNVTPMIGAGIAFFGNQIITTTLITFAVDCHRERSADIGVWVNFIRQIWGFIGPFYFTEMFATLGYAGAAGLMSGLVFCFGTIPVVLLHIIFDRRNRRLAE